MSRLKYIFKDLGVMKLWTAWTRRYIVSTVVRRCIRDRGFREVIQRFRHTVLRQRRTLLLAATAAYKDHSEKTNCDEGITDDELQSLLSELEIVQDLAKLTLYCTSCGKRLMIDRKQAGVRYCVCKDPMSEGESSDGWVPFMEAENVIIWRKEYKPGKGLYAYKVYGRYPEVRASDFAAIQVDGAYRRVWDSAVAALAVVQRNVSGVPGQAVLHWEVLWPRLFANRDYVYIRRHKEYDITTSTPLAVIEEPASRTSVHAKARRKSMESYAAVGGTETKNKVYIILNKSCEHPDVPETKHAIRVSEYWSHMVVKTVDGAEKPGMEFVLTYYDEPAVGGMPGGVAAWASSRAAPVYLDRMRRAAADYRAWAADGNGQEVPDFVPFGPDQVHRERSLQVQEQDMESSKQGPDMENGITTRDQSSQTDAFLLQNYVALEKSDAKEEKVEDKTRITVESEIKIEETHKVEIGAVVNSGNGAFRSNEASDVNKEVKEDKKIEKNNEKTSADDKESKKQESENEKASEEEENNGGWWRSVFTVVGLSSSPPPKTERGGLCPAVE